jgi:hypothetical protein
VISCRIASAVFFLLRLGFVLDGPQPADRSAGFHKFAAELLESAELGHLTLGLTDRRPRRQGLRDRFAVDLVGEPEIGTVSWLAGAMAVATGLATATGGAGNGAGAKVAQLSDLPGNLLASLLKFGKGVGHREVLLVLA